MVVLGLDFFSCSQGSHDRIQFSRCSCCCVGIECNICRCTDCIHGSGRLTETEDDDDDDDSDYVACKWFSSIEFFEVQWNSCCKNEESVGRGTSANVEWALKPRQLVNWIARRRPLGVGEKCSAAEDIDCLVWVTVGENFSYLYIELERLENPTDWRSNHSHSELKVGKRCLYRQFLIPQ